ncbi:GPW/gp25 family protein [Nonomuraea angiospora]|uniref:GPW/gp25 family protein n=1 Tax=Nonomuraea angiospora TaxID=46172 RepID=UPI0033EC07BF
MNDDGRLLGQGVAFPPAIGADGRLAWSAGSENIRESIRLILMTAPGERLMRPAFGAGLGGFLFEPNVPATHRLMRERITHALSRWEGRISVTRVVVEAAEDPAEARVTIEYELVVTQETGRLGLTVRLAG